MHQGRIALKPLFDHFGKLAPYYEYFIRSKNTENLKTLLDLPHNALLLDAGGGTGRISQAFIDDSIRVVIGDESYKMLQEAQRKDGLQPICTYTEVLPFKDELFDGILMVDALHHVADPGRSTSELWRVLKPGGRIVIEEPNIDRFGVKLLALAEKLALMRSHFLAPDEIADLFGAFSARCRIVVDGALAWIIIDKEKH
jgi:demethylmenaquinone methyltransferase/2-methoxy-6-polyprenyl-1,4-benzoquinol methylase